MVVAFKFSHSSIKKIILYNLQCIFLPVRNVLFALFQLHMLLYYIIMEHLRSCLNCSSEQFFLWSPIFHMNRRKAYPTATREREGYPFSTWSQSNISNVFSVGFRYLLHFQVVYNVTSYFLKVSLVLHIRSYYLSF